MVHSIISAMEALWFDGKQLNLRTGLEAPRPKKGESLVRVKTAGICATDIEITRGYMGFIGIPGHEFADIVTGPDSSPFLGKRVTGEINLPCRKCGPFKPAINAIKDKKISVTPLIDSVYSLKDGIRDNINTNIPYLE